MCLSTTFRKWQLPGLEDVHFVESLPKTERRQARQEGDAQDAGRSVVILGTGRDSPPSCRSCHQSESCRSFNRHTITWRSITIYIRNAPLPIIQSSYCKSNADKTLTR